jgi:dihydroxyacid dehydratase/phosphogluconate dehydratase
MKEGLNRHSTVMARLDLPSLFVYGDTIRPGAYRGKLVDIVSAFEAAEAFCTGYVISQEGTWKEK